MPKKKKEQEKKVRENDLKKTSQIQTEVEDKFDFGGFPKDISLKKNLGCGS